MIGGLMIGGMAAGMQVFLQKQQLETTINRTTAISEALLNFQMINGRLPCPSPLTAQADDPKFGREILTAPANCDTNVDVAGTFRATGKLGRGVRIGAVPTRSLNLPDEMSQDAWGQRFLYAVTEKLATPGSFLYTDGAISVVDSSGTDIVTPTGGAHYAIVSSSTDRSGSYSGSGGVLSGLLPQGHDMENWDNDAVFVKTLVNSNAEGASYYNDHAFYNLLQVDDLTMVMNCMAKKQFYDPSDPNADVNGCVASAAEICQAKQMFYTPSDPQADTDGCVNRVATCETKQMSYKPSDPQADGDGCVRPNSLSNLSCPSGQAMVGFTNGTLKCISASGGGSGGSTPPPSTSGKWAEHKEVDGWCTGGGFTCSSHNPTGTTCSPKSKICSRFSGGHEPSCTYYVCK